MRRCASANGSRNGIWSALHRGTGIYVNLKRAEVTRVWNFLEELKSLDAVGQMAGFVTKVLWVE